MRPEGEGWITARTAAKMLGVQADYVKHLVKTGELTPWEGCKKPFYYRVEAVEVLARRTDRAKRLERREAALQERRTPMPLTDCGVVKGAGSEEAWAAAQGLICAAEAARILGVSRIRVGALVRSGQLASFQWHEGQMGSRHWLLREAVEARREERASEILRAAVRAEAKRTAPVDLNRKLRKRYTTSIPLKQKGRIGPGDLSAWEWHFREWITARQAAFLLSVGVSTVYWHRRQGHVRAMRQKEEGRNNQWYFLKVDVERLCGDPVYNRRRWKWEEVLSVEGKARQALLAEKTRAQALEEDVAVCAEVMRKGSRPSRERPLEAW